MQRSCYTPLLWDTAACGQYRWLMAVRQNAELGTALDTDGDKKSVGVVLVVMQEQRGCRMI